MNKFWLALLFLFVGITAYTQCNYRLVEKAARQAGSNTVFLREFKVRLSEASMDNPVPTGRFPIFMNEGFNYRFSVANAAEEKGEAIVELVRRGQVYAANNISDTIKNTFDFSCERSATYQLQINFGQGHQGCAAVVMSLILNDSLTYIEPDEPIESDSLETLLLWAENKLQIASNLGKDLIINATVSQGEITDRGRFYIVKPENIGELNVYVEINSEEGKIVDADTVKYIVNYPPFPQIILPGESMGTISQKRFTGMGGVRLEYLFKSKGTVYNLKKFSFSESVYGFSELVSYSSSLTYRQQEFIRGLSPGDTFYITDIEFTDPNGKLHFGNWQQVLILE